MERSRVEAMRKRLIKKAREETKEAYAGKETHIIKAVNLLGDLDNVFNLMAEQLREWYGIHFPELDRLLRDNESYARIVLGVGCREGFNAGALGKYCAAEKCSEIEEAARKSAGADISEAELGQMKCLAENALKIRDERAGIVEYIEREAKELMPNLSELAGALLAARLLAKAGSLKKMAIVPSSTMQLYGAERALFQAMKQGSRMPKHGLIFGHALVASARPCARGRMARALAGKLSIAARADYFGKADVAAMLKGKIESRAKEIRESGKGKSGAGSIREATGKASVQPSAAAQQKGCGQKTAKHPSRR